MLDVEPEKVLVKLYELNEESNWSDKCTGHLFFYVIESDDDTLPNYKFIISSDADSENILHQFDLDPRATYDLQQESLITWTSEGVEYALSFQSANACRITFETIKKSVILCDVEDSSDNNQQDTDFSEFRSEDISSIPDLTYENLSTLSSLFSEVSNDMLIRNRLNHVIEDCNYISKLVSIFHTCEDLDDHEGLKNIYLIIRGIFSLSRFTIFETLVKAENVMEIIGMLEFNPYLPERIEHRKLLKSARLTEIIPFSNPELREMITQTHRLQYLYDLMAPTPAMLDDRAAFFASLIYYRKSEIVEAILDDQAFLSDIFTSLGRDTTNLTLKEQLLKLINEICNFSKVLQLDQKRTIMNKLLDFDVLSCIDSLKDLPGESLANYILEILCRISESNTYLVRKGFVSAMERGSNIFEYLCDKFTKNPGIPIGIVAHKILLTILDNGDIDTANKEDSDLMEEFLVNFYGEPINRLIKPLFDYCSNSPLIEKSHKLALGIENVLDIIATCINCHTFYIKDYIHKHDLLKLIGNLVVSKHAFISHGCIKIIRLILCMNNKFYTAIVAKDFIIDKFLDAILHKFNDDSMINSSLIDLFENINISEHKIVISELVERRRCDLESINYVPTFTKLIEESEKIEELEKIVEPHSYMHKPSFLIIPELLGLSSKLISEDEEENKWFQSEENDSLINGSKGDTYHEIKNGTNDDITILSINHIDKDNDLPGIKPKFKYDDECITLKPKIVKPAICVSLKRPKSQSPDRIEFVKSALNDALVDYSDDDNEENIPPSEPYVIEINELMDVPTSKNRKC